MRELFEQRISSPSVVVWTPFNESWGIYKVKETAQAIERWDDSRPILANAWADFNGNYSFNDSHLYDNDVSYGPVPHWGTQWGA